MKPCFQSIFQSKKLLPEGPRRGPSSVLALALLAACAAATGVALEIDGKRALEHAIEMTRHGPHPAGSLAQTEVGLYIIEQLKSLGLDVRTDGFTAATPLGPKEMVNIWGVLPGSRPGTIILASHYDSKYFEEFLFVGANDGAASSGIVLELARVLSKRPAQHTIWFTFFDGEEAFGEWSATDGIYGSRRFVDMLRRKGELGKIRAMILLDLVGGQDLQLFQEYNSTDWLRSTIWKTAREMGHERIFSFDRFTAAEDDHMPFLRAGIPAVDIIDMSYAHWHRPTDTVENLSSLNMAVVGNVVLASLPEIERRLLEQP